MPWSDYGGITPEEGLLHEVGHAAEYIANFGRQHKATLTPNLRWRNLEEKRNIKDVEIPAARALWGPNTPDRSKYNGWYYKANSSFSKSGKSLK